MSERTRPQATIFTRLKQHERWLFYAVWCLLLWAVWWIYVPAIRFGLIWDDPTWFSHSVGQSFWQMIRPNTAYQFFRPLGIPWASMFVRDNGTVNAPLAHAAEIWEHLINTALAYQLARIFFRQRSAAFAIAVLFATFPFAQQAVAWGAPLQPITTTLQFAAWLLFWRSRRRRVFLPLSLLLFTAALLIQESTVALAAVPLGLQWYARQRHGWRDNQFDALIYPVAAAAFLIAWVVVPRADGITEFAFRPQVFAWFAQGFIYPFANPFWQRLPENLHSPWTMIFAALILYLLACAAAYRQGKLRVALLMILWAVLAVLPATIGLNEVYIGFSPRMLYFSALPMLLFGGIVVRLLPWRSVQFVLVVLLTVSNVDIVMRSQAMLMQGTQHIREMLDQVDRSQPPSALFINFPDQYVLREPPYPLGFWGLPLAPVVEPLAAFVRTDSGRQIKTTSISMPWVDTENRQNSPFHIDLRGVIHSPEEAVAFARQHDLVFVSRFAEDGGWLIQEAGRLAPLTADRCAIALFADAVCLHAIAIAPAGVELRWRRLDAVDPNLSIFVHEGTLGQAPIAQQDGDAWLGTLPLTNWPDDVAVVDYRALPLGHDRGQVLRIGLYNWATGERLRAVSADGTPLPEDAFEIPIASLMRETASNGAGNE